MEKDKRKLYKKSFSSYISRKFYNYNQYNNIYMFIVVRLIKTVVSYIFFMSVDSAQTFYSDLYKFSELYEGLVAIWFVDLGNGLRFVYKI